jgi:hypothetical protein
VTRVLGPSARPRKEDLAPESVPFSCLSCGRTEKESPLLVVRVAGKTAHICPQCLPALIHHPDRLTEKIQALLPR